MNFSCLNPQLSYGQFEPFSSYQNLNNNLNKNKKLNKKQNDPFCGVNELEYPMYQDPSKKYNKKVYQSDAQLGDKGLWCNDETDKISRVFFGEENMHRVQKQLRNEVFTRTKGQFTMDVDQDESKLIIVMRAVLEEYGRFLPNQVVRQIKELNKIVINQIAPDMVTEVLQGYGYIKDSNNPIRPISRPMNVNRAGRRTLPSITTMWNI
jgi:hypothetical protein